MCVCAGYVDMYIHMYIYTYIYVYIYICTYYLAKEPSLYREI